MNTAWTEDKQGRFKKRRELLWLTAEQLLDLFDNRPEKLWKRVRELEGASDIVRAIAGISNQQHQVDMSRSNNP